MIPNAIPYILISILNNIVFLLQVDYFEVGSPLSNDYYLGTKKGELYGLDHNIQRASDPDVLINLRAETDVKGLYMTGK